MVQIEMDQLLVPRHASFSKRKVEELLLVLELNSQKKISGTLSIAFVSPAVMRKINRERRQKDQVTDVLSFRLDPLLAEILLCYPVAKQQAKEHGWSVHLELVNLLIHGVLHTLGFDHQTSAQAKRMLPLQQKILSELC